MLHLLLAALLTSYTAPNPPLSRHDVAIGGDAHHTLVAWTQFDDGAARVHVAIPGNARELVMPIGGQLQMSPAIAFDGADYLVVWQEVDFRRTTAYAARVSGSGELLDATPIALGDYTNGLPPRATWSAGVYRVSSGTLVTGINHAGARVLAPAPAGIDSAIDLALPDDTTVFARSTPPFCSGFSMLFCQPGRNFLTFQPGGDINLFSRPVWLEAADHIVVWSDNTNLYIVRNGLSDMVASHANNATIAGSLIVYERDERLYSIDLNTKKESVLTEAGAVSPSLLDRGNGRYTLLYRTTTRPAQLRTIEIGAAVRRRTF